MISSSARGDTVYISWQQCWGGRRLFQQKQKSFILLIFLVWWRKVYNYNLLYNYDSHFVLQVLLAMVPTLLMLHLFTLSFLYMCILDSWDLFLLHTFVTSTERCILCKYLAHVWKYLPTVYCQLTPKTSVYSILISWSSDVFVVPILH